MKKNNHQRIVLTLAAVTLFVSGAYTCTVGAATKVTAQYTNPILYADYSDPDVIRVDDRYYMVASTFHFSPGLPVLESRDLVHWKLIAHAVDRLSFDPKYDLPGPLGFDDTSARARFNPEMGHRYGTGIWAPAIRYHDGRFYIFFPTPTEGIFMVSARKPEGPWTKPVAVIAQPKLEDPCPFWDEDGQAYLIHSAVGAGPLILHKMKEDGSSVVDDGKVIVEDAKNLPTLEGPKLYKRNGYYYIFAPYGGVETGSQAVLRSKDIYGPYEVRTALAKGNTDIQGPHQGGYVETPDGEGWFIHFNSTGAYGRIVHLQPVKWVDDWPVIGEAIAGSVTGQPVASHVMPDIGKRYPSVYPQTSDEFSYATLGVQWEWNHNPEGSHWSLAARRGFLRLDGMPAPNFLSARNTLTQVQQGRTSQVTIRMEVDAMQPGQHAGLGMLQVQPNWIGIDKLATGMQLVTSNAGVITAHVPFTALSVQLRMNIADEKVSYAYSVDEGKNFTTLGEAYPLHFSWWKGARPALFSYTTDPKSLPLGHVDIDWAHFEQIEPARD